MFVGVYIYVPVCDTFILQNTLREEITEQVRWNVNRDSMEDKQRSLLDLMPALKNDIKHQVRKMEIDMVYQSATKLYCFEYNNRSCIQLM